MGSGRSGHGDMCVAGMATYQRERERERSIAICAVRRLDLGRRHSKMMLQVQVMQQVSIAGSRCSRLSDTVTSLDLASSHTDMAVGTRSWALDLVPTMPAALSLSLSLS